MLPAQRFRDPGRNKERREYSLSPASYEAIWRLVKAVAERAGLPADEIGPHRCATPSVTTLPATADCTTPSR